MCWAGNLVKHETGIMEASGIFERTEGEDSVCNGNVEEEAGADCVSMDLLEFPQ